VTKKETFQHVQKWLTELKDHAEPDIVVVLVGNKLDLVEENSEERKVSVEEA
jgi:GTPase SAR1 family protein